MAEFDELNKFADEAALQKQTAFILAQLDAIEDKGLKVAQSLKGFSVKLDIKGAGTKEIVDEIKKADTISGKYIGTLTNLTKQVTALTEAQKKHLQSLIALNRAEQEEQKTKQQSIRTDQEVIKLITLEDKAEQQVLRTKKEKLTYEQALQRERDRGNSTAAAEAKIATELTNEYAQLNKALKDAEIRYKNLALTKGFDNEATEEALKTALDMRAVLDKVDGNLRNYQRNVGNYKSAFDGLGMSFSQVARELPSLAINTQTFLLAISNNLPMVFDEIGKAKEEIKAMNAEGKQTSSVASRVVKSLFSWQVGLSVLITLFTIFGPKLIEGIKNLFGFGDASEAAAKATERFYRAQLDLIKSQKELDAAFKEPITGEDRLNKLLGIYRALGKSRGDQLEIEKQILDQQALQANQKFLFEKQGNGLTGFAALDDYQSKYITALGQRRDLTRQLQVAETDAQEETLKKLIDRKTVEIDVYKEQFEAAQKIVQDNYNFTQALAEKEAQIKAYQAEQQRKLTLESERIQAEIIIASNERIISNEKSTMEQRIAALNTIAEQRKRIALAEKNAVLSDPANRNEDGSYTAEALIAIKNYNAVVVKIEGDAKREVEIVKEAFRLRDLEAETEIQRLKLETIEKTNAAIYKNEALTGKQRIDALDKASKARLDIINNEFNKKLSSAGISDENIERIKKEGFFEIENKKITNKELKALIENFNSEVLNLSEDVYIQLLDITKDYYEKEQALRDKNLKDINRSFDLLVEDRTDTANNQIISLGEAYRKGKISAEKYASDRKKIESDLNRDLIRLEIDRITKILAESSNFKNIKLQIEEEIALRTKEFNEATTDADKKRAADRLAVLKKELDAVIATIAKETELYKTLSALRKSLFDADLSELERIKLEMQQTIQTFSDNATNVFATFDAMMQMRHTRRLNQLQDERDQIDRNAEAELAAIEASGLSEAEKAAKVTILNARTAAQKEAIARKERQIKMDEARFQKAQSIFNIVTTTAQNVVKAFPNPFLMGLAATLGAAQLAFAIATPIPKFKKGLQKDYEGPGIVGDGGRREAIIRKDGSVEITPSTDTLTYLNKGDRIHPDADQFMKDLQHSSVKETAKSLKHQTVTEKNYGEEMSRALQKHTEILNQIATKRENHVSAKDGALVSIWKHGANMTKYIDENTNW